MISFKDALLATENNDTTTANGMPAQSTTDSAVLDLFGRVGSMRGENPVELFAKAFNEDSELTAKVMLWTRDIRGGSGEREVFRNFLRWLEKTIKIIPEAYIRKIPEVGRWDDLLVFENKHNKNFAFGMIANALGNPDINQLVAKWLPRKGKVARELREAFKQSPKEYRKMLVILTNVVETKMCAKQWYDIDFEKIPSLAQARYANAFKRNCDKFYNAYLEGLENGTKKINANAVYPYDVIKTLTIGRNATLAESQWNALPDYFDGLPSSILPVIDVSGSMLSHAGKSSVSCMSVAISLGMYVALKNPSKKFGSYFITFESKPSLIHIPNKNLEEAYRIVSQSSWGGSTNIEAVFDLVLSKAVSARVHVDEMPKTIIIFSDMQFNSACRYSDNVLEMISRKYENAGYKIPNLVFWNLNGGYNNVPVRKHDKNTTLVSGFSPSMIKNVLKIGNSDPYQTMLDTVEIERYEF